MNLEKLFEMQKQLDLRIEQQHPRQEGEDRLAKKILAFQVELGELANEWRGFKYWSKDQKARTEISKTYQCLNCNHRQEASKSTIFHDELGTHTVCERCDSSFDVVTKNPLLEEYVDCLHFILSIGLELPKIPLFDYYPNMIFGPGHDFSITAHFTWLMKRVGMLSEEQGYYRYVCAFMTLGEMLGFTWEEIEQAYLAKNKINHARQENGY